MPGQTSPGHALIRELEPGDPSVIADAFTAQGWRKPREQYEAYLRQCEAGERTVFVAAREGVFTGYVTILWKSDYPPFAEQGIPEIADFNVLMAYRRRGIGSQLLDQAECRIAKRSTVAGIGVGLTADYGAAQVLYVKRGYVPDGRGVYQRGKWAEWGAQVTIDDGLALYLTKTL